MPADTNTHPRDPQKTGSNRSSADVTRHMTKSGAFRLVAGLRIVRAPERANPLRSQRSDPW